MKPVQNLKKQMLIAYIGNLLEHYDTALYGFLSPFLAPLFFPNHDPVIALLLSYLIIPIGMLAKPLGSLYFGHIGDTQGRQKALFLSLTGMGLASGVMGLMPTYSQLGALSPLLLLLGRILQNFCAAGENVGGAVFLLEKTDDNSKKDFLSSLFSATTIAGILIASAAVSFLCHLNMVQQYWRLLYLFGCLTAVSGSLIRRHDPIECSVERAVSLKERFRGFWEMRGTITTIAFASGFSYATYSLAFILINGFVPLISDLSTSTIMNMNTFLLCVDFITLPIFGILASKYSREKMMLAAATCAAISGAPLFYLLEIGTIPAVLAVRLCVVIIGVWFSATFHSWAQGLVPRKSRYSVVSFSYAIGSQLLGGPTAAISLWMFHKTGLVASAAWYWVALGSITSALMLRKMFKRVEVYS